jgi:ABC-2 type transport system ATP-binding protein
MIAVVRSELYRLSTIRSSAFSLAAFCAFGILLSMIGSDMWALLAGVAAFGFGATGIAQHYRHRTAVLLYLARPRRIRVLLGQLATAVVLSAGFTAFSGALVLFQGNPERYLITLVVAPLMAVLGAAAAAIARSATYLFVGFAAWILFVEAMYGKMQEPLPFSAYLDAATGDVRKLFILLGWILATVAGAAFAVRRDLNGE